VGPFHWFIPGRSKKYVLGPISFATNKRVIETAPKPPKRYLLRPTYLYSAAEIDYFSAEFVKLHKAADDLFIALEAEDVQRKASPQKLDAPPE
jgi:hypothetical protein